MSRDPLTLLGIETSCDETAAAVVRLRTDGSGDILSNVVQAQLDLHAAYGGVVPEIAARAHVDLLDPAIRQAMADACVGFSDLDGVAATAGPGLIGGVIVGLTEAKAIALGCKKPFVAVNHLEAHALSPGLSDDVHPPYLLLLVSGGHTQLVVVNDVGSYTRLGTTLDDALGEAFDKAAKLLGLGYPGGPEVERWAARGQPTVALPRPMMGRKDPNFSLAGLKTALRQEAMRRAPLAEQDIADLCASFQSAVCDVVRDRVMRAMDLVVGRGLFVEKGLPENPAFAHSSLTLVAAGGVAANTQLREALSDVTAERGFRLVVPPPALCTDNAAMIAWAGAQRLARGLADDMSTAARARWPLDPEAPPALGAGVKA